MNQDESLWGIVFFESEKRIFLPYNELSIDFAGEVLSLTEAIEKEADKIDEFETNSSDKRRLMDKLHKIYKELEADNGLRDKYKKRVKKGPAKEHRLVDDLEQYISIPHVNVVRIITRNTHKQLLSELEDHLLVKGSVDYGAFSRTMVRFTLNYTMMGHNEHKRKSGMPYAWHTIDAARILVQNGQDAIVVCGTLFHDYIEEKLDKWVKERVSEEKRKIKEGLKLKPENNDLTDWERVIRDNKDEYYEVATTEFYSIALSLYRHGNFFPPSLRLKFNKDVFNIMEVVAKLSRTNNVSYYNYLQRLFYQDPEDQHKLDEISFDRLKELLEEKVRSENDIFVDPDLLKPYLEEVDRIGAAYSKSQGYTESQINVFREVLVKIADRLNNTRDTSALKSAAKRLYNSGYKNAYTIQAIEAKLKAKGNKLTSEEKSLVERKFLNKLKVSALYQMISEVSRLEKELPRNYVEKTKAQLEEYKKTDGFNRVTSSSDDNPFDGLINYFNFIANETNQKVRKQKIQDLDADPKRLYAYALAFKSIFEHYLVSPIEKNERYKIAGFSASKLGQDEGEIPAMTLRRNVTNIMPH